MAVERQYTAGNHAVQMEMVQHSLVPSVENRSEPNLATEAVLRIGGKSPEGRTDHFEQKIQDGLLVAEHYGIELMGKAEHHMEVLNRQYLRLAFLQPLSLGQRLALGAVAIPTGVIRIPFKTARIASFEMSTELRGAAGLDGAHHL